MLDWRETITWLVGSHEIPLWLKLVYTLFVCILVPVYWRSYGPANFLWFSDVALLLTMVALWLESPFLASMQAVSVTLVELVWTVDFLAQLLFGVQFVGIAGYMFETDKSRFLRGLSLFHVPLPIILLWLVYRLGYDSHAWMAQTVLAWVILLSCFFFTKPSENINWVFGAGKEPQKRTSPGLYPALVMAFYPLCVYLPTHLVLRAIMPRVGD